MPLGQFDRAGPPLERVGPSGVLSGLGGTSRRRRNRTWSSNSEPDLSSDTRSENSDTLQALREIDDLLLSPVGNENKNMDLLNVLSVNELGVKNRDSGAAQQRVYRDQEEQAKNSVEKDGGVEKRLGLVPKIVSTPDCVKRALFSKRNIFVDTDESTDVGDEEDDVEEEKSSREDVGERTTTSLELVSFSTTDSSLSYMTRKKWLAPLASLLHTVLETPRSEIMRWTAIILLWVIAASVDPTMLSQQNKVVSADNASSSSSAAAAVGFGEAAPPFGEKGQLEPASLVILSPGGVGARYEQVASGDVMIKIGLANLYPHEFRHHRSPRVCLRLGSKEASTFVGCVPAKHETLDIKLKDLGPGKVTLYASLMSEVKKLAKDERTFYVLDERIERFEQVHHHRQQQQQQQVQQKQTQQVGRNKKESEPGCSTTCTKTCSTTFLL